MDDKLIKFQNAKKNIEKKVIIGGALVIIGLLLIVLLIDIGPFGLILVIPGIIYSFMGVSSFSKLRKSFKTEVLKDLIIESIDNGVFNPEQGLSQSVVYSTEFLRRADIFHAEDYLAGEIDGVNFISSDVKLQERRQVQTKNGTRTEIITYFLGRVFRFDFNKSFDGYLQVLEKGKPVKRRSYKKIKLESVDFNKKFKTFCTSEHAAFYVLTPHFMEALRSFEKNNKGSISFSFIDNHLFIGINNFRDTFELKMFRVLNETTFNEFRREMEVIKEVVHELKLNNDIFKKE